MEASEASPQELCLSGLHRDPSGSLLDLLFLRYSLAATRGSARPTFPWLHAVVFQQGESKHECSAWSLPGVPTLSAPISSLNQGMGKFFPYPPWHVWWLLCPGIVDLGLTWEDWGSWTQTKNKDLQHTFDPGFVFYLKEVLIKLLLYLEKPQTPEFCRK